MRKFIALIVLCSLAGCDLPQEQLVCQSIEGHVTYRSPLAANWRMSSTGAWVSDSISQSYAQNAFESCHTEKVVVRR
jgi:hypothetical protein